MSGISFEANWAKVDFDDVTYGRTSNDRQGYFLSGYWNVSDKWKSTRSATGNKRSIRRTTAISARWRAVRSRRRDTARRQSELLRPVRSAERQQFLQLELADQGHDVDVGVGADWQAMDALKLTGSYLYVSNEGNATFGFQQAEQRRRALPLTIDNFDNSKQQYFNLKGI